MEYDKLLEIARNSTKNSYCPYSNFAVGTALLTKNGKLYSGSNIENDGIQGICAERVAFSKAISEGEGKNSFVAIMVIAFDKKKNEFVKAMPCGYCRQFMSEFVDENFKILVWNNGEIEEYTIEDLLPNSFRL